MRMRSIVAGVVVVAWLPAMAWGSSGIFRSAFTEIAASNANGIAVGDFDADTNLDVVTANAGTSGNDLNVFIGFGDGTLSRSGQIVFASFPSGVLLGDFNGDEVNDLMVSQANDNTVVFVEGLANNDFFAEPINPTTVGQAPAGMAAVDLDSDGDLDLLVANEGGDSAPGTVSVLRAQGDGTFTLVLQNDPQEPGSTLNGLPADLGTRAVAVGNIDADPALDIVALNTRSSTITLYSGDGDLLFTPRGSLAVGAAPHDLALIDVNGDGNLDVLTAEANTDAVAVRLGNGNRTFAAGTSFPVGTAPTQLRVADMNDDGLLDIVASNSRSGDVSLLLGDGMGGFATARSFVADAEPQVLALGDFNNDGRLDPVAATQGSEGAPTLALLLNRDGATLHGVEDVPAGNSPTGVATADMDDDGLPDVIVSGDAGDVYIFPSTAAGLGEPQVITLGGRALSVLATDLNGDTLPDLAMVDNVNSRIGVALATAPGRFAAVKHYATSSGPAGITTGDFNDDGRPDLAVSAIGPPGRASVLLQQADGTFGPARASAVEETPLGIAAIDANCDGKDDLIVANQASHSVTVLRSNGDGTFTNPQTLSDTLVGQGPQALAVADFNRDGTADFAVTNSVAPQNNPSVRIFKGDCAGSFTGVSTVRAGNLVTAMVARDFTGDQIVDLGIVNQADNSVRVLRGSATTPGNFAVTTPDTVSRMPIALAAGDLDGDGRYDAMSGNSDPSANNISVLTNCSRDDGCNPFGSGFPGSAALRGDGNNDARRSAADLVAASLEVSDGDGEQVEDIAGGSFGEDSVSPGVDANGDGIVTPQDRRAVAHRIFGGA